MELFHTEKLVFRGPPCKELTGPTLEVRSSTISFGGFCWEFPNGFVFWGGVHASLFDIDTPPNSHILKGDTFSEPSYLVSIC